MSERHCPRCHTLLTHEDSGVLLYCSHCGAPQVLLSEELREQAAESAVTHIEAQDSRADTGNLAGANLTSLDTGDPTTVDWTEAVRVAGLGGLVTLGLGLISMAVPFAGWLVIVWALIAPIIVLGIYCSRRKHTRISAGFGARLGLVTGLTIAVALFIMVALQFILVRFIFHGGPELDANLSKAFTTFREAHAGQPLPPFFRDTVPEFRVGMVLSGFGLFFSFYLVYAVITGAFGGLMRSRSRAA